MYATARTWWLHGGRPGCPLSCRVHGPARCGPASLWNINMTRNIISHDSRRRGNTKYYPAEAPVGWPAGLLLPPRGGAVFCFWQQPAGHAAVTERGDKLAFARHDASTWPQKACVRAAVSRAPIPQLPLQFSIGRS